MAFFTIFLKCLFERAEKDSLIYKDRNIKTKKIIDFNGMGRVMINLILEILTMM